ncbi:anhydro-N-acetylmuramic acid kinase [Affinibrenneria salicis]|uniref:Anhydro-N-acetylmuramic acid kinase n=1 Tax=Affinibrenneria salicis TaxID=2590031 RepID=A0A5J5FV96_9GAMM|nr:anhydro-N-acetylmuramic acid kinase [Affinibrenneria salicis]KAA8997674.1 anhydro-N-acetylmuramic acid kinase [Affinibrenneria salicis]
MEDELYLGVMSGTSLDGVDIALMNFAGDRPRLMAAAFTPMPQEIRNALSALCSRGETSLAELGELDHRLGHLYARAINELLAAEKLDPADIRGVGCHGQTIWHAPGGAYPFTLQIGDANIIAARTGVTTVADFRRKDMAFGGQGAPLVPAFHQALFADPHRLTVVLNIGGISNISLLIPDQPAQGYDTGPGNLLLDAWIEQQRGERYDRDARWALSGRVNDALLAQLLDDPYFSQPAPKSTGREHFSPQWLQRKLAGFRDLAPEDVQATLAELTASSISRELERYPTDSQPARLLVCGGGAKNPLLMTRLSALLPGWTVAATTEYGLDVDYVEAAAFAWLARRRLNNLPGNIPQVTGASQPVALGAIYPAETQYEKSGSQYAPK